MSVLLFSMISASLTVGAEEALTLQKARELALERSATLKKATLAVDAASLEAQAQGYAALPTLTASAGSSLDYGSGQSSLDDALGASAKVSASETVFDGGKTAALVKKYGLATEAAREELRAARVSLIASADSAFFAELEAEASVDAAASDLAAAKLRLDIAKAKADAGALSKSDYLQSEAEAASYEAALNTAKKSLSSAKAKLASLTGLPAGTKTQQIDFASYDALLNRLSALDDAAVDKLIAAIAAIARENSPSLAGYSLASQEASLAIGIAKKDYLPTVTAGVSHGLSYAKVDGLSSSGSISLTATMSLDLWNTKNTVASAEVAARQAELDASDSLATLELDASQDVYSWLSSAHAVISSAKALEYAQSNYENVLEKFKLSAASASDLSDAEALVSTDKTALITARYDFLSNLSALRSLAGLEDEAKLLAAVP